MCTSIPLVRRGAALLCAVVLLGATAQAGTLRLGQPSVQGSQFTFPVTLAGGENSVAALNFTLTYDPEVFRAVDASAGTLAQMTNKVVTAHAPVEGAFNVVMVGFNQQTLDNGEVARVVLERVGGSTASNLSISDPTLASWDGGELPSTGRGLKVSFGDDDQVTAEETDPEPRSDATPRETEETEDAGTVETAASDSAANSGESGTPGALQFPGMPPLPGPLAAAAESAGTGENGAPAGPGTVPAGTEIPRPAEGANGAPAGRAIPGADGAAKEAREDGMQIADADTSADTPAGVEDRAGMSIRVEQTGEITTTATRPAFQKTLLIVGAGVLLAAALAMLAARKVLFR